MVETARDIVSDLGPEVAGRSGGLVQVAKCSLSNSERDCRRVLVGKHALSLPVKTLQLKDFDHIPILRIPDWFDFFLTHSCLHLLCGLQQPHPKREADILTCFWENFRALRPRHEIFQRASEGRLVLSQTFPLLVHGDEGRGRKHAAHFVMSFHPVLGMGFKKKEKSTSWAKMECNFSGHTYTNRFLIATMRKRDYSDQNVETWNALMEEVAAEAAFMADDGVVASNGLRFWGVVLGIVGDWPFLHKSGGFCRSFNNIQKRKTQKNLPVGICHLCQGGQRPYPFEQLETRRPLWRSTMFAEDPFVLPNPLAMSLLHEPGKEASLWCFDWFHTMHLGVLRNFIGSVLALLSDEEPQSNVDLRFAALSARYRRWCHSNSRRAHITKLTKESIGWEKQRLFHQRYGTRVLCQQWSWTFWKLVLLRILLHTNHFYKWRLRRAMPFSVALEFSIARKFGFLLQCANSFQSWGFNFYGGILKWLHWPIVKTDAFLCFNQKYIASTISWWNSWKHTRPMSKG